MTYDYEDAMYDDVMDAVRDRYNMRDFADRDEAREQIHDDLWVDDSVTGNGSGSYTFNRAQAREYLEGNEDLLVEAMTEFGCMDDKDSLTKALTDPEWGDCTIRCYLLCGAIERVLEDLEAESESSIYADGDEEEEEDE